MPDDYPRPAWDEDAVLENLIEWQALLEQTDLAEEEDFLPDTLAANPAFAPLARKHGIHVAKPVPGEGIKLGKSVEKRNRRQVSEMIRIAEAKGDDRLMEKIIESHLHFGNQKVPQCYLIFNMTPALQCPSLVFPRGHDFRTADAIPGEKDDLGNNVSGTSLCQAFDTSGKLVCYAISTGEKAYKTAYPYRVRQNQLWRELIVPDPQWLINAVYSIHERYMNRNPIVAFRWSECGDAEDQGQVDAIFKVSKALSDLWVPKRITTHLSKEHENPNTRERNEDGKLVKGTGEYHEAGKYDFKWRPGAFVSYLYTARSELDWSAAKRNKLVVLGSDWKGPGLSGQFVMVNDPKEEPKGKKQKDNQWHMCPMKCKLCQRCPMGLNTRVLNH